ncbi:hypothetical protein, partial [Methylosinus sp. Sm6]|uniref:hypothetical protein n=1 Tax=Methylosinus sp. Sm6 TaxID=2866948 RepID=UPI001C9A27D6
KKREIVANIWRYKRRKTTLAGIRDYVALAGGTVLRARRPRDKMWWVPAATAEERAAMLARMPELRIYPRPLPAPVRPGQQFWGAGYWSAGAWVPSDAAARWRDRAVYVADGVETRVAVTGLDEPLDSTIRIAVPRRAGRKAFYNRFAPGTYRIPSDADAHVVTIAPNDASPSFAVPAGLAPMSVRPERVSAILAAPRRKAWHGRSFYNASYRIPSDAETHLYSSVRFLDPARIGSVGRPLSFWGWSRSPTAPFTSVLTIDVTVHPPKWAFRRWWGVGVWARTDLSPLWRSLEAIRIAQAPRDDIFISLKTYEPITFGGGLKFGEFKFGDWRKAR